MEEPAAVEELKRARYDTWEWNFGRSPNYNLSSKRKWDGGILEPRADVEKGVIRKIVFYGDFLAVRPLDEVTEALRGRPLLPGGCGRGGGALRPERVLRRHPGGGDSGYAVLLRQVRAAR